MLSVRTTVAIGVRMGLELGMLSRKATLETPCSTAQREGGKFVCYVPHVREMIEREKP